MRRVPPFSGDTTRQSNLTGRHHPLTGEALHLDVHLRIDQVVASEQLGEARCQLTRGQPLGLDLTDQRRGDRAGIGDRELAREVILTVDGEQDLVVRTQLVLVFGRELHPVGGEAALEPQHDRLRLEVDAV